MMVTYAVRPRSLKALTDLVQPSGPEALPAELYDQSTYTDNVTTALEFFTTTRANRQLTNAGGRGQLPSSNFFELAFIQVAILIAPSAALTPAADLWNMLYGTGATTGAPICYLELNNKRYGEWSLWRAAAGGQVNVNGFAATTDTTTTIQGLNGSVACGGGIWVDQQIVIPPVTEFNFTIEWGAAVDTAADVQIRPSLIGTMHRRPQ